MESRSRACQTCKLRKIKCDAGQPSCQKCMKARRICIPTQTARLSSFSVHVENRFASGKVKRPRGPRSSYVTPSLPLDLETRALSYYLQYHLHPTIDGTTLLGGWSKCIFQWRASGRSSTMADLGLSALALVVFSRIHKEPEAAAKASAKYTDLLRLVQERIVQAGVPSLSKADIDSCLLTIFLMARYEGSTHYPGSTDPKIPFETLQTWSHHDGAIAILKLWYDSWSEGGASNIIKQSRRGCIKSRLMRNIALPDWLLDGRKFGEEGLSLEYDRILVRMVKMHHATNKLEQAQHPNTTEIEELDREGHAIDSKLQEWKALFPPNCSYRPLKLKSDGNLPRKYFYSSTVYCYSNSSDAALWCQYFSTTMLLLNTIWRVLKLLRLDDEWKRDLIRRNPRVKDTADSLASSIPFCLERVNVPHSGQLDPTHPMVSVNKEVVKPYLAALVVWPLTIVSSLDGIDETQQRWFRAEIAELGRITGDGGLECAETEQWAKL